MKPKNKNDSISRLEKRRLLYTINAHASMDIFDFRFEESLSHALDRVEYFMSESTPDASDCTEFGYLHLYSDGEDSLDYWLCIESDDKLIGYLFHGYEIVALEREQLAETINDILDCHCVNPNDISASGCEDSMIVFKSEYVETTILCDIRGPFGRFIFEDFNRKQLRIALEIPATSSRGATRMIYAMVSKSSLLATKIQQFIDEAGRDPIMVVSH